MSYGMNYQGDTGGGGFGGGGGSPFGGGGGNNFGGGGGGNFGGGGGGSQPAKQRKSYDEQTLIPVTARMVLNAQPSSNADGTGGLALRDNRELHQIKLVGAVRSYDEQSTNVTFEIEDGTGLVEVKQWLDDNDCAAIHEMRAECLKEHVYVRITGQVKDYDGKKSVVAHSIRKLCSGNELTYHMLEVVYSSERFKRNDTIIGQPTMMQSTAGVGFGAPQGGGVPISAVRGGSGNELKDAVENYFRSEGELDDSGAPITGCIQKLTATGQFNEQDVRKMIDTMASEGTIYSTINEDHYKFVA